MRFPSSLVLVTLTALLLPACVVSTGPSDAAAAETSVACTIPGYGPCASGTCITTRCASGDSISCTCTADGRTRCTGGCFAGAADASSGDGTAASEDAATPPPPACTLPDGTGCAAGVTCLSRSCADGAAIQCTCAVDGTFTCENECPACLSRGEVCAPSVNAVCCSGLVCTRMGPTATCQPFDAGPPCGTFTGYCCNGTATVEPICSGTTWTCPSGSTPSSSSCIPGADV